METETKVVEVAETPKAVVPESMKAEVGEDGTNAKLLVCKHCDCKILQAGAAAYVTQDIYLHTPYKKGEAAASGAAGEVLADHFCVDDQFNFENIAVTREVPTGSGAGQSDRKFTYLICADCERGPVGIRFLDTPSLFYVTSARVKAVSV